MKMTPPPPPWWLLKFCVNFGGGDNHFALFFRIFYLMPMLSSFFSYLLPHVKALPSHPFFLIIIHFMPSFPPVFSPLFLSSLHLYCDVLPESQNVGVD
jgi:hypothetical protein